MLRFVAAAGLAALAGACAQVNPEPVAGATYAVECPSGHLEFCFAKAREFCPRGYEVVRLRRPTDSLMMAIAPDRLDFKCQG